MTLVGVRHDDGSTWVGSRAEDAVALLADVRDFWSDPWAATERDPVVTVAVDSVTLVPPALPDARVFCVGLNYRDHVAEGSHRDDDLPDVPTVFGRWTSSLCVDGDTLPIPPDEDGLDWEGEVLAWVGRTPVDDGSDAAAAAVFGWSAFDDVTARGAQKQTTQWTLGKNGLRTGPVGPIVPASQAGDLRDGMRVTTRVNGTVMQQGSTADMIFDVGTILTHIARTVPLRPGDLVATGTPSGVGYARTPPVLLQPGDEVVVEVEGLGTIRNRAVAWSDR